jgi:hypothetical protein
MRIQLSIDFPPMFRHLTEIPDRTRLLAVLFFGDGHGRATRATVGSREGGGGGSTVPDGAGGRHGGGVAAALCIITRQVKSRERERERVTDSIS